MSQSDTGNAIGKITQLLGEQINARTQIPVTVGRPEPATGNGPKLNLFLYEASFDPSLKNQSLDEGRPPPMWLVLKYLMTAFDDDGNSDTIQSHENCGKGIRALQELSFLKISSNLPEGIYDALKDNPETLKITFDEVSSDLLSKLMQGGDEKYRFSLGFQVRPVMIAPPDPPAYNLLVGIDYTKTPHDIIGEKGINIPVFASLGPLLDQAIPSLFEIGETISIAGERLDLPGLSVRIGQIGLPATDQRPDGLSCLIDGTIISGEVISAGSHPLSIVQTMENGRKRSSNLWVVGLLPVLDTAATDSVTRVTSSDPNSNVYANIDITGSLLGTDSDDVMVSLYREGKVVRSFDGFKEIPPSESPPTGAQKGIRVAMITNEAVPPGEYRIILRVNGMQAKNSPTINLVVP